MRMLNHSLFLSLNAKRSHLTWNSRFKMLKYLNRHKELIPLFAVTGAGMAGATFYLARLAFKNPDVSWDRKNNQHPWLNLKAGESIKFFGHKDPAKVIDHMHVRPDEVKNL